MTSPRSFTSPRIYVEEKQDTGSDTDTDRDVEDSVRDQRHLGTKRYQERRIHHFGPK